MPIKKENGRYVVSASVRHSDLKYPVSSKRSTYTDKNGDRFPITSLPRAKKELKALKEELQETARRKVRENEIPNWEDMVKGLKERMILDQLSKDYIYTYEKTIEKHTFPIWKGRKIDTFNPIEILELLDSLIGEGGYANQTAISVHKYIKKVFNFALEKGFISGNPTPKSKIEKKKKNYPFLTIQQARKFLREARKQKSPWYYLWAVALFTGMRNGELMALTWEQVNLDDGIVEVNRAWTRKNGFKPNTKTNLDRVVPINDQLRDVLLELYELHGDTSKFVLPRLSKWERGDQARETRFFLGSIGLPQTRFHDLRATWCTMLFNNGVPVNQVMEMGGWTEIKTVMNYLRRTKSLVKGGTDSLNLL